MAHPYTESEPLYLVIFRDKQAEQHLKAWAKKYQVDVRHVDNNRLRVYNQHTWDQFRMTWSQAWDRITVWDCWNRRHIEVN